MHKTIALFLLSASISITSLSAQDFISHIHEIHFGTENFSRIPGINGGNYLFSGYNLQLLDRLAIGAQLSSDIVPHTFNDALASFSIRANSKTKGKHNMQKHFSLFYMNNLTENGANMDFIGTRISLINFSNKSFQGEFLPLTFIFSPQSKKMAFGYSLMCFNVMF